ncbi:unnamed protein product [Acanthoscelides obtectus]|uniref:Uncharacterized protein n=1 Tax=Acanthoscelides obtectus TaxID=200917 RepID=A0A9P0QBY4_ACAOB|nr:unnamed protein product [Acanthoscelides obtectus]CAK1669782.1 hypothetical protein AOBTE_LOCUS27244 [Acanthoscelides obtectus]
MKILIVHRYILAYHLQQKKVPITQFVKNTIAADLDEFVGTFNIVELVRCYKGSDVSKLPPPQHEIRAKSVFYSCYKDVNIFTSLRFSIR